MEHGAVTTGVPMGIAAALFIFFAIALIITVISVNRNEEHDEH